MEQENDADVERHPRHVEERGDSWRGEERSQLVDVAHRLGLRGQRTDLHRGAHLRQECCPPDLLVELVADAREHPVAHEVHDAHEGVEADHEHRQRDEGGHAAARQHPVVDLQHEQRPGQHQDVDDAAEKADCDERPARRRDRLAENVLRHRN